MEQLEGYTNHWSIGALAWPLTVSQIWLYGKAVDYLLGVKTLSAKATPVPLWLLALAASAIFIDDVGTAVGMHAEEFPREAYEGNEALVNWSLKGQEWGIFRNHTDALRYHFAMGALTLWLLYSGRVWMSGAMKWGVFLIAPLAKIYAGHGWWDLKPNSFTVKDFFFFKKGRDVWERTSEASMNQFNAGRRSLNRRVLVEGSKTFRMLDKFGWLRLLAPSV